MSHPPDANANRSQGMYAQLKAAAHANALRDVLPEHDMAFTIESVVSVQYSALAEGRLRRKVTPHGGEAPLNRMALCDFDTATLSRIDIETVALARDLLAGPSADAFPLLRTPVSLQTLGHSTKRNLYLAALRELPPEAARRVVVEIVNVDEGTPISRISEAVAFLAGACRAINGFTDPTARALAALRGARIGAATVDVDQLGKPGADRSTAIVNFAEMAKASGVRTALRGVMTELEAAAARASGVTYLIRCPVEARRQAA